MAYCRVETADGYTVMSNYHLRDMRLSLKARGLLSQILSLPEKWDMTISGLSKINRECSDTIASIIKELEATGYITRYRERRKNGTYGEVFYDIRMKPRHFDEPKRNKSERVKPKQMSSAQLSKEKSNKEKENKELFNINQSKGGGTARFQRQTLRPCRERRQSRKRNYRYSRIAGDHSRKALLPMQNEHRSFSRLFAKTCHRQLLASMSCRSFSF